MAGPKSPPPTLRTANQVDFLSNLGEDCTVCSECAYYIDELGTFRHPECGHENNERVIHTPDYITGNHRTTTHRRLCKEVNVVGACYDFSPKLDVIDTTKPRKRWFR